MDVKDRIAHNESVFRELNERIELGHWPGQDAETIAFRCECASLGCNVLVELKVAEYERVRANARHFLLAAGHELPDVETVVERHERYVVVEKLGEAGEAAEQADPRTD